MQHTPNLSLKLPEPTDFVQVEDLNENFTKIDEEIAKVTNEETGVPTQLTEHLTDFEYQEPTVIGKQLQLVKKSGTKRLFIKIVNDLSGPITVSLDNGASSKPLVDANGEAVNQLEKGFAEVVEDTSFFTLRSRGISSTDLQALIEIANEAEANESDLKKQFAQAVNEVDVEGDINLPDSAAWAEILAEIPNIKSGKIGAVGKTHAISFSNTQRLIVNGLTFKPSLVIAFVPSAISATYPVARANFVLIDNDRWFDDLERDMSLMTRVSSTTVSSSPYWMRDDGFEITTEQNSAGNLYYWIAFK